MMCKSLITAIVFMLAPSVALSCACCAEPGARFEYQMELDRHAMMQLAALTTKGPARLYQTACGLDCVQGIDDPQDTYQVEMEVHEAALVFDLSDTEGRYRGGVEVHWPMHYTLFGVDTDPNAETSTTILYKEMRVAFDMVGTGDFEAANGAQVELVLSGLGNICHDITRLRSWSVTAWGEGVDFRLFGALEAK